MLWFFLMNWFMKLLPTSSSSAGRVGAVAHLLAWDRFDFPDGDSEVIFEREGLR